ncbi:MAG: nitrite reductase, partial [Gammaproteobacteria bacterium]|nr:nitrite reductase [Gammaproteobacteria bacterium]
MTAGTDYARLSAASIAGLWFWACAVAAAPAEAGHSANGAAAIYRQHCAACHGPDRLGGVGPALLPENLKRLRPKRAAAAIAKGLPATQMPAFEQVLDAGQIDSLVELIYAPLGEIPEWGRQEIEASHVAHRQPIGDTGAQPIFDADVLNLFLVVESGDHHVTVLDGDRLEPIHRFKSRHALHGGPKFSPDGRYAYLAS